MALQSLDSIYIGKLVLTSGFSGPRVFPYACLELLVFVNRWQLTCFIFNARCTSSSILLSSPSANEDVPGVVLNFDLWYAIYKEVCGSTLNLVAVDTAR